MALFNSKQNYLGIDLGSSSIKIVELRNEKGKPRLVTYGFQEQGADIVKSDNKEVQEKIILALKKITKRAKTTSDKVIAALPSYSVFSSIISLPAMSRKELMSAIHWEAKKFVPMPIEEMILDWKILEGEVASKIEVRNKKGRPQKEASGQAKHLKILLTAAPKNLVQRYVDIFTRASLKLIGLETDTFALERSLIGSDKSAIMIVDIGAMATNISIIQDGIPLLNKSIDVGGNTITKAIANNLNIDLERAEQFKRDFGISTGERPESQIPKTIEFVIGSIVNEIRFCFNLFQSQSTSKIEKIILAGGSAFLPNLPAYFERVLNIRTYIGNPWARVVYPLDLKPALDDIGPRFAVTIGLAMRQII